MTGTPSSHTPPKVQRENCTLTVLSLLRQGVRPSEIWKKHSISERNVKYILRKLQSTGLIKKLGYGTWEVVEGSKRDPTRCKVIHRVDNRHTTNRVQKEGAKHKPETIRGHGIQATVKIPKYVNWTMDQLPVILEKRKIPFIKLGGGQGYRIQVLDVPKVWLCVKGSIVIYFPKGSSWFGKNVNKVAASIMVDVLKILVRLERMLGIETLKLKGSYWVKFSRQHDSLIKDALARIYRKRGRPIYFRNEVGTWGLIDNSFNFEELEAIRGEKEFKPINPNKPIEEQVRPDDAARDDIRKMQSFVNGVQRTGITPEFILEGLNGLTKQSDITQTQLREAHDQLIKFSGTVSYLDENMKSHIGAINSLSLQSKENAKTTVSLREAVSRLAEAMLTTTVDADGQRVSVTRPPKKVDNSPSIPLATKPVKKDCGLCGESVMIPGNKKLCPTCDIIVKERRPEPKSLDSFIG